LVRLRVKGTSTSGGLVVAVMFVMDLMIQCDESGCSSVAAPSCRLNLLSNQRRQASSSHSWLQPAHTCSQQAKPASKASKHAGGDEVAPASTIQALSQSQCNPSATPTHRSHSFEVGHLEDRGRVLVVNALLDSKGRRLQAACYDGSTPQQAQ